MSNIRFIMSLWDESNEDCYEFEKLETNDRKIERKSNNRSQTIHG